MSRNRSLHPIVVSVTVVLALLAGDTAIAAQLEEFMVTVQRREQNLQDVGVSVTAFGGEQVRDLGFVNTVDVTHMTPNLNYTVPQAESSQINFFLRGVGLNDFADAQENPVAVYVDDVYKPAMGGLALQLFDIERIEVLRGPQGALFGRNSTGGVIHYVTEATRRYVRRVCGRVGRRLQPVQGRGCDRRAADGRRHGPCLAGDEHARRLD